MCELKTCKRCNQSLPTEFFQPIWNNRYKKYYTQSYCKGCMVHKQRERLYGVSEQEFAKQLARQNNQCMICGKEHGSTPRSFHVDHCHTTGRLRGILCHHCNIALGMVRDNTQILTRMIKYLQA